jgi:hypothetical protein
MDKNTPFALANIMDQRNNFEPRGAEKREPIHH